MKNSALSEAVFAAILLVLLVLFLNPFDFWMPDALLMTMIVGLLIAFGVFAVFVWREKSRDEREERHRMIVGRNAFLLGAATLTLGIVLESLTHKLDPWLVITLAAMVLAKVMGLAYHRLHG